jgi:uncharacterized membrane protein YdjX (TVP38/TMEM64 family)
VSRRNLLGLAAMTLLALAMLIVSLAFEPGSWVKPERLSEQIEGLRARGPLLLMGIMVAAVVIGPIPTLPISVTSGLVFGFWAGSAYAVAGALAGALLAFWIARLAGRDWLARRLGGHVALCTECSDRFLFWMVLGARLVPVVSFAAVSYAAGLTAMSSRAFALSTLLGMLPMTAIYVGLGTTVVWSRGWLFAGSLALVAAMLLLPRVVERYDLFGLRRLMSHGADGSEQAASR